MLLWRSLRVKDKLIIIGAGGHGKVCLDIAKNFYKNVYFVDDNKKGEILSCKIISSVQDALKGEKCDFFVAIGDNKAREKTFNLLYNITR